MLSTCEKMKTLIRNARIVNRKRCFLGSLLLKDELIVRVAEGNDSLAGIVADRIVDAAGNYLLPGVIDDHVHFREPGLTHKADIASESRAAAAGGVTSYMEMPNTLPQTTTIERLEEKFRLAEEKSLVNYSFYFGATHNNGTLIPQLDRSRVCGVKVFMGASTGNMLVSDEDTLRSIFSSARIPIAVHCEEAEIIQKNIRYYTRLEGADPPVSFHPLIRTAEACYRSSQKAVGLARETGAHLHLLHVSTAQELKLLSDRPLGEKQITAEAAVAHLCFSDEDYSRCGTRIKCNPAVKSARDRTALWEALRDGRIDVIGTDHAPHLLREKEGGCMKAASGMPLLPFSLVAMLEAARRGVCSIEEVVEKMCHAPALLFGIKQRGEIREGYFADLVLVSHSDIPWKVVSQAAIGKCGWSPFEGDDFHFRIEQTFVNGRCVYDRGTIDETCRGMALQFCR